MTSPLSFAIIGAGSVGTLLAASLAESGYSVGAVIGRGDSLQKIPSRTNIVAICTPDQAIASVRTELAALRNLWIDTCIFHVSGAMTSSALEPLAVLGAQTASFHPLGSFVKGGRDSFQGTTFAIEGSDAACTLLTNVAVKLGGEPLILTAAAKPAYHLAASMASNYLVTISSLVQEVLTGSGLPSNAMSGLVRDTVTNLDRLSPGEALTGPIVRGDAETVKSHLNTLQSVAPHILPSYRELARATVDLAFQSGRLAADGRDAILALLKV